MSVTILRPTADGALLELSCSTGTTHYALIDEATADDADYVYAAAAAMKRDRYTIGMLSVPSGEVITSVSVKLRGRSPSMAGGNAVIYLHVSGTDYQLGTATSNFTTSFAEYTVTQGGTNPATKLPWEQADLSGATITLYVMAGVLSATQVSQLWVEVTSATKGTTCLTLRPNGDKSVAGLSVYPASPTTRYDKIDEATKDTGDYVYVENNADTTGQLDLEGTTSSGTIGVVMVHAIVQANNAAAAAANVDANGSGALNVGAPSFADTSEHEVISIQSVNPLTSAAWAWDDIAAMYARLYVKAPTGAGNQMRCYQLWVEIWYTPPLYFDSVEVLPAGSGYAALRGVLRSDASEPDHKRMQIASDAAFSSVVADSTELAATETPGDTVIVIAAWTPSSAGTYYGRLGARTSGEAALTYKDTSFVVNFPSITSQTVSHISEERYRVTVVVSDDYADPPEVSVTVDGQTGPARLQ